MNVSNVRHLAVVVGAGPAGIFAAKTLADGGVHTVVLNRDIKPGGLAEYGIYPSKHRMKEGLRKQFRGILLRDDVDYYGFVRVGAREADLSLDQLRQMGFQAVLVTSGAQGTKWLGLPGEDLMRVYHAKDVVYYYNQLPPFSERDFPIGRRVIIVGIGNVMIDITRWLVRVRKVDEVIAVARRGPGEIKFDAKEVLDVIANFDVEAIKAEFARIRDRLITAGQDPDALLREVLAPLDRAEPKVSNTRVRFEFLSSPAGMKGDDRGGLRALEVDNTTIYPGPTGDMKTKSLGTRREIPCDMVVFAIGDKVDENMGLPFDSGGYTVSKEPKFPVEGISFESAAAQDVFVAGWSRQASTGLVGVARRDGTMGAQATLQYLATKDPVSPAQVEAARKALDAALKRLGHPVVDRHAWQKLEKVEAAQAAKQGLEEFKYGTNKEMLGAIQK